MGRLQHSRSVEFRDLDTMGGVISAKLCPTPTYRASTRHTYIHGCSE